MKNIGKFLQQYLLQLKGETSLKTIVIVCAFILLGTVMVNSIISNIQLQYQKSQLSTEVFELTNQNKALQQKIEQSSTSQYVEETAREKLGMVKSNEVPIKIVETADGKDEHSTLKPSDKMGIYMNDWYQEIEEWVTNMKG